MSCSSRHFGLRHNFADVMKKRRAIIYDTSRSGSDLLNKKSRITNLLSLLQKIECPNYFHQLSRLAHHFCCTLAFSAFMRQQKLVLTRTDQVMSESSANELVEFILSKGGFGDLPFSHVCSFDGTLGARSAHIPRYTYIYILFNFFYGEYILALFIY